MSSTRLRPVMVLWAIALSCGIATAQDSDPPTPIGDLGLAAPVRAPESHMVVRWTAPQDQDNGPTGLPAAAYDLRYSTSPIQNDADFGSAVAVTDSRTSGGSMPIPASPGESQSTEVIGLQPGQRYYFAIKSRDGGGNWSSLSNTPHRDADRYEGYGFEVTGGGGGEICRVTSLADSGAGSLRSCLFPTGGRNCSTSPRYVVFDVGGTITLMDDIRVDADDCNLTLDGSTAPDPGITIRKRACPSGLSSCPAGHDCLTRGEFKVGSSQPTATSNIVLTYLRFRGNYELAWGACGENSAATLGLQYHFGSVVLDHLTIRNGSDASPDMWTGSYGASRLTLSKTLIGWSNHPLTISDSGGNGSRDRISIHHNVIARSGERMPQVRFRTEDLDFRNNLIFDWEANADAGSYAMRIPNDDGATGDRKVHANIVNNYFIPGGGNPRTALYYGSGPGSESSTTNGDGGPASCTTANGCSGCPAQGEVVSGSYMGELWVSGNVFPDPVCDKWSTVASARSVPVDAAVATDPVGNLVDAVLTDVGTIARTADEIGLLDEIAAHMGASGFCGNDRRDDGESCDGDDLGGQSCASLGLGSGTLACTIDCELDTSGCGGSSGSPEQVRGLARTDVRN